MHLKDVGILVKKALANIVHHCKTAYMQRWAKQEMLIGRPVTLFQEILFVAGSYMFVSLSPFEGSHFL